MKRCWSTGILWFLFSLAYGLEQSEARAERMLVKEGVCWRRRAYADRQRRNELVNRVALVGNSDHVCGYASRSAPDAGVFFISDLR